MTPRNLRDVTSLYIEEPDGLLEEADRMSKILDAKYAKSDLQSVAAKAKQLTTSVWMLRVRSCHETWWY